MRTSCCDLLGRESSPWDSVVDSINSDCFYVLLWNIYILPLRALGKRNKSPQCLLMSPKAYTSSLASYEQTISL